MSPTCKWEAGALSHTVRKPRTGPEHSFAPRQERLTGFTAELRGCSSMTGSRQAEVAYVSSMAQDRRDLVPSMSRSHRRADERAEDAQMLLAGWPSLHRAADAA